MKTKSVMIVAGEPSGDALAADLVAPLRKLLVQSEAGTSDDHQPLQTTLAPRFFGAGGQRMAAAGVEIEVEMTRHAVTGIFELSSRVGHFIGVLKQLTRLAIQRQPDVIVCVDFSFFNRLLARAIRKRTRQKDWFHGWKPKIVQYVSPQVWASRPHRVYSMAETFDLLLTLFPFEREWYARRVPQFKVGYVGHPIVDRHGVWERTERPLSDAPLVLLLPGSRRGELARHLPVITGAWQEIRKAIPQARARMVLPNEDLARQAKASVPSGGIEIVCGGLTAGLQEADAAIASTGTVTLECALFGVPTVALYRTSWATFQLGKRIATVKYMAMPNILADEEVFPEFIQDAATPGNLARAALELLQNPTRRAAVQEKLKQVVASLGVGGANERAAEFIAELALKKN